MALQVLQAFTSDEDNFASLRVKVMDIQLDVYPTGGYTNIRALVGFSQILLALIQLTRVDGPNFVNPTAYDIKTDTLRVFQAPGAAGSLTEIPNSSNYTGVIMRFMAIGR